MYQTPQPHDNPSAEGAGGATPADHGRKPDAAPQGLPAKANPGKTPSYQEWVELLAGWKRVIVGPGQVTELRALKVTEQFRPKPRTQGGFFDDAHLHDMASWALHVTPNADGVYFTLNPLNPAILARRENHFSDQKEGSCACDSDVLSRRWLLIDADPERPTGVSATDEEKAVASRAALAVRDHLRGLGWPEPILADSGNGYHLLYRIDLPVDDGGLVRRVLAALAARFDAEGVKIDRSVHNPGRICKFYGTLARKGRHEPGRPHRRARLLEVPGVRNVNSVAALASASVGVVSTTQLEAVAAEAPGPARPQRRAAAPRHQQMGAPAAQSGSQGGRLDVGRWLSGRGVGYRVKDRADAQGRTVYVLANCPFNQDHRDPDSCVMQSPDGMLSAQCFHNSCAGRGWRDFRDAIGKPGAEHWEWPAGPGGPEGPAPAAMSATPAPTPAAQAAEHKTDLGNARRLVRLHGDDYRHCHPWVKDLVWEGRRWKADDTAQAARWAKEAALSIYQEALATADSDERKALSRHAVKSESAGAIAAMLRLARSEPGVPVLPSELDRDHWALNALNGTLDLRTGALRPHRRGDMLTKLTTVEYDPAAKCPVWDAFLLTIMDNKSHLVDYLRRVAGYFLTGDVSEQCMWVFYGGGANGKSTFLNALLAMLGEDYSMQAPPELIMARQGEAHPTERADLFGRRLVACVESEQGKRLAESLIKQLTGGEKVRARRMGEDFWEFDPTHKIVLGTNHRPVVRGADGGIWRRLKPVPFVVTIPEGQRDKKLAEKLRAEQQGILAWAVRGCLEWQQGGLGHPPEVSDAAKQYRAEMDTVNEFIEECCIVDPALRVRQTALYAAYAAWAGQGGEVPLGRKDFNRRLEADKYKMHRSAANGAAQWHGLALSGGPPRKRKARRSHGDAAVEEFHRELDAQEAKGAGESQ